MKFTLLHADDYPGLGNVKFPLEFDLENFDPSSRSSLIYVKGSILIEAGAKTEEQDPVNGYDRHCEYPFSFGCKGSAVVRGE